MRVLYHDDFDGLVSAAILSAYWQDAHRDYGHEYIPVDYHLRPLWHDLGFLPDPETPFAIVDFMYHPRCDVYFDHHQTSFLTTDDGRHYAHREHPLRCMWGPTFDSCAGLVHHQLKDDGWATAGEMLPLVAAANMIDRAGYSSPRQYYAADDPAIALDWGLREMTNGQKRELLKQLAWGTSLATARRTFAAQCDAALEKARRALSQYPKHLKLTKGQIARMDLVPTGLPRLRYATFYLQPDAAFEIVLFRAGNDVVLSAGQNPWMHQRADIHLGELLTVFGGGGHAVAAGATFSAAEYDFPHGMALYAAHYLAVEIRAHLADPEAQAPSR
jgi:hypothetical protein